MRRVVLTAVGVLLILAGGIWTLQGFGSIRGSAMSGKTIWAVIGPVVAVVGVGVAIAGNRPRRSQR